ncbi:MAG: FAD-dependent oxidoreductase [Candidatus Nanopelagicales bacterium]
MTDDGFDAVFLAVGAHIGKRAYIPAGESAHDPRRRVACCGAWRTTSQPLLGRRVVVYGGGNTAMDAARTAKRLGADEAIVVYRRTRDRMPAHDIEVQEALEEGVLMRWLSTIKHVDAGHDRRSSGWNSTTPDSRSPPARPRSWPPTRSCSPWVRTSTCRCSTGVPGSGGRRMVSCASTSA